MQKNLYNYIGTIMLFVMVIYPGNSFAQLSGTKTIPGDYATIEAAINDLDTVGVGSGGVTFDVAAGHTEIFTSDTSGRFRATGNVSNPIIFQKSGGGANPVITAGVGTGTLDGIIVITGGDYITFDGIDIQENSGNITSTTQMEWGYALVKRNASAPVDGCQYVTIQNCNISLNSSNTSTSGIYSGNHLATSTSSLTLSDQSDAMNNCLFSANDISQVYVGCI